MNLYKQIRPRELYVFKDSLHIEECYPIEFLGLLRPHGSNTINLDKFKEVRYYKSGDVLVKYENASLDFVADTMQVGITIYSKHFDVLFKDKKVYDKFIKDLRI